MGLDIYVKRVGEDTSDWFYSYEDHPELTFFSKYEQTNISTRINFEKTFDNLGYKYSDYKIVGAGNNMWFFVHKVTRVMLNIENYHGVKEDYTETVVYVDDAGYQRKGQGRNFYAICDEVILDMKTLLNVWAIAFSDNADMRDNFKKNVIDNFVESETFVIFSY